MTLQGLPAANTPEGMSCVTTLPAPITVLLPIVTPGKIVTLEVTHTLSPIVTGLAITVLKSEKSCVPVSIMLLYEKEQFRPIVTFPTALIYKLPNPVCSPTSILGAEQ